MKNKNGNIFIIVVIIFFICISIIMSLIFFARKSPGTHTATPADSSGLVPTVPGDFFRDGKVTQADIYLVQQYLSCKKGDVCWNKVVGKTHDGDNPIYTSDLDMNGDGVIDNRDIPTLSK